jgi:hypothetical protein
LEEPLDLLYLLYDRLLNDDDDDDDDDDHRIRRKTRINNSVGH